MTMSNHGQLGCWVHVRLPQPYLGLCKKVDPRQRSRAALRAASTTVHPLLSTGVIIKPYIQG